MKDKLVFKYDIKEKKGIIITDKGKFQINLNNKADSKNLPITSGSGSQGGGYGLHLI